MAATRAVTIKAWQLQLVACFRRPKRATWSCRRQYNNWFFTYLLTGPRLSKPYLSATWCAKLLSTPRRNLTRKELVKTAGPLKPLPDPPPPAPAPTWASWRSSDRAKNPAPSSQLHAAAAIRMRPGFLTPWLLSRRLGNAGGSAKQEVRARNEWGCEGLLELRGI